MLRLLHLIPLSVNYHKDRWMWHYTTNGIYSLKSGYRLEISKKKDCSGAVGSSLEPRVQNAFWRKVWSQEVPQKILYFNWRAIKNYLPCRSNLLKRKIISEDSCPICNVNSESVIHALWSCPNAQKVWKKVLFKEVFTGLNFSNYGDLFEIATMYLSKYEINKTVIEGRSCAQDVIFNRAHHLAGEYGSLVKGEPNLIVEKPTKWSPPPAGKYKLNVDAAFIPETGVGGIDVVVRNDKGEVMAAMALPLASATSSKHAEIMAFLFEMKFAWDAGFSSILIESDSQGVVNDVKKDEEESWASDGHLIDDIKRSLQHFEDVIISFSPRGGNQVAHFLAKHALNCNTMLMIPSCKAFLMK
ncbi:hypothetical protein PRUPE_7G049300 [Prunus persica]|uniref:Uncharacterized protein n=1 Tax=Prunus persica TaxID=3760 RepID=M5XIC5_PRUPE|nr:hypothetical protein PRUPE_7G049300 [Prunus persica]